MVGQEFMQKVFETRMEIDECDSTDSLFAIQTDITTQYQDHMEVIKQLFAKNDGNIVNQIREQIEEARYLEKMLDEISAKE